MKSVWTKTLSQKHGEVTSTTHDLATRVLRYLSENECYLTISGLTEVRSAREFLESEGWEIARAFVFGAASPESILSGIPAVSIRHSTQLSREIGVVLHAVRDAAVTPVMHNNRLVGSCIEFDDRHELHIMDISATLEGDALAQAQAAYAVIDDILGRYGFIADNVVRYWNYLENIANTYQGFNLARDAHFARHGITQYPAATGIESYFPGRQLVSLSLEAIAGLVDVRVLQSDVQGEASEYGPRFSRGMVVDDHRRQLRKIYISGTSHLGPNGSSIVSAQPTNDVSHTMEAIQHLLFKEGAGFDDIAWSIVYCKDRSAYQSFLSLYDSNGWQFPYLPVFVNICRPELRFEMECFAATNLER